MLANSCIKRQHIFKIFVVSLIVIVLIEMTASIQFTGTVRAEEIEDMEMATTEQREDNDTQQNNVSDTEDRANEEAIQTLVNLNILSGYIDGTLKPEQTITRAEFTAIITRLLGLSNITEGIKEIQSFDDVKGDFWAAGDINVAVKMGIITGYGDGKFEPEAPVTYEQAIKMLICAMGYELYSEQKGGYPSGYLIVAAEKGITKHLSTPIGVPAKRGIIAQIVFNSLDVNMMEKTGFGSETKFSVIKGKTLLTQMKIEKKEGRITATGVTTLTGNSGLHKDEVKIDGVIYNLGNTNAKDYLGYQVTFYSKEDNEKDERILIFLIPQKGKNDRIEVEADKIKEVELLSNMDIQLVYWRDKGRNDDSDKVTISSTADLIYNGKAIDLNLDDLLISTSTKYLSGKLILLDSNSDNKYDVVFVTAYDTFVVDTVASFDNKVYLKYSTAAYSSKILELDIESSSYDLTIEKAGEEIGLKDIREWDILSVARSKNTGKQVINVQVSSDKIEGTITETGDEYVVINKKEYELENNYRHYIIPNHQPDDIKVNDKGVFYLNTEGKISAYDGTENSITFAYLAKVQKKQGLGNKVQFKIFTAKGEWDTYDSAEKIRFNGNSIVAADVLLSLLYEDGNTTRCQIVSIELNENGEISSLNTALTDSGSPLRKGAYTDETVTYIWTNKSFMSQTFINKNTIVFLVPEDKTKEADYQITTVSTYFPNADQSPVPSYKITSYNESDFKVAEVLVVEESDSANVRIKTDENIFLVDKVTTVVSDNDFRSKVAGIYNKKYVSLIVRENLDVSSLKQGDMIQMHKNSKGEMAAFLLLAGLSDLLSDGKVRSNASDSDIGSGRFAVYGDVYAVDVEEERIIIIDDAGSKYFDLATTNSVYIYDMNKNKDKVYIADIPDIQKGDYVALRVRKNRAYNMVIVRLREGL